MVKWYDRIGNPIEMQVGNGWIKGIIVNGYRTGDGIVTMETAEGKKYWCGVESGCYRKAEDSLRDLLTQADRIRSMSDEEMSTQLFPLLLEVFEDGVPTEEEFLKWLKSEAKE